MDVVLKKGKEYPIEILHNGTLLSLSINEAEDLIVELENAISEDALDGTSLTIQKMVEYLHNKNIRTHEALDMAEDLRTLYIKHAPKVSLQEIRKIIEKNGKEK